MASALGAGAMGEVYRARDTRLGREVALKILPKDLAEDPVRRQRFEQEARAVAALNHPNVVSVYDVGDDNGVHYLVTELADGESMPKIIGSGPLRLRTALDIAAQVADGLAAAHVADLVHRDLKPANTRLTRQGQAKVLDFGLAQHAIAPNAADVTATASPTLPGMVIGTFGYMAPEQVRCQSADRRSDIFSFGVVLHEMLSGKCPFSRDSAADVISAILKEDPPDLPDSVPPPVDRLVRRCVAKNPEERFQSAQDLAFAILNLQSGSGVCVSTREAKTVADAHAVPRWWIAALAVSTGLGFVARLLSKPARPLLRQPPYRTAPYPATRSTPFCCPLTTHSSKLEGDILVTVTVSARRMV